MEKDSSWMGKDSNRMEKKKMERKEAIMKTEEVTEKPIHLSV